MTKIELIIQKHIHGAWTVKSLAEVIEPYVFEARIEELRWSIQMDHTKINSSGFLFTRIKEYQEKLLEIS